MARPTDHPEPETYAPEALTGIHRAYTLAATNEPGTELEDLMVKHFIETLAEVAMAVAARNVGRLENDR